MTDNPTGAKKRDEITLTADIVDICRTPVKKTKVMYATCSSFSQLTKYLDMSIKNGLIQEFDSHYKATEKGLEYLRIFGSYQNNIVEGRQNRNRLLEMLQNGKPDKSIN